jgi:acyl-CoA thioesterase I
MSPLIIIVIAISIFALAIFQMGKQSNANNPQAFLKRRQKSSSTNKVVVCAGDSLTHGNGSANYVDILTEQFAENGYDFVNGGVNGQLAWNILQRLDDIIACQPDYVTLLVGTNDVNATFDQSWEDQYRKAQKLPEKPTLEWYSQNIESIIQRLQSETDAQLALLSLPMLGEDLDSEMNGKINAYNVSLKAIATEKNVAFIDLHAKLVAMLSSDRTAPPYEGKKDTLFKAMLKHYLLRKSWDTVSEDNGFQILTDYIHLNDKGAKVIAELIGDFLQ